MLLVLGILAAALWAQRHLKTNIIWLDDTRKDTLRSFRANIFIALISVGITAVVSLLATFIQLYWPKLFP